MPTPSTQRRRGNASIVLTLAITSLAAFGAMSVDLSVGSVARAELRTASESAAHAGTRMLDGTTEGMTRARNLAAAVASRNHALAQSVLVAPGGARDGTIELGYWANGSFIHDASRPAKVTAVRVTAARPSIGTYLRRVYDRDARLAARGASTSLGGGMGSNGCPIPIAIPSCAIDLTQMCNMNVTFSPDTNDSAGWALIGAERPSSATIRDAINNCAAASTIEDIVTLNNGSVSSAAQELASKVGVSADQWNPAWGAQPARSSQSGMSASQYGHVLEGQIIVFEDPLDCADTKYNGSSLDIVGYMNVAVFDVDTTGQAASRTIRWHSSCDMSRSVGGGGFYGARVYPQMKE